MTKNKHQQTDQTVHLYDEKLRTNDVSAEEGASNSFFVTPHSKDQRTSMFAVKNESNALTQPLLYDHSSEDEDDAYDAGEKQGQKYREIYHGWRKYMLLASLCLFTFGGNLVFDVPAALFDGLKVDFDATDAQILMFYSAYTFPSIIMALVGGYVVDIIGPRTAAVLLCGTVTFGNFLFAAAVEMRIYWLALVGRLIFGLAGESLITTQNAFLVRWFSSSMRSSVFGVVLAFSRVGSAINFAIVPHLAAMGLSRSVWIASSACLLSLFATGSASWLDHSIEAKFERARKPKNEYNSAGFHGKAVSFRAILQFPRNAWMLMAICACFYVPVIVFNMVAVVIIERVSDYDNRTAALFVSLPNFVAVVAVPVFGRMLDKIGRNVYFVILAAVMVLITQLLFLLMANDAIEVHPALVMMWQGLAYSLGAASIWPLLAFVVENNVLAFAYGATSATQNALLALVPILVGKLDGASAKLTLFAGFAVLTIVLGMLLLFMDAKNDNGKLNASARERYLQQASLIYDDSDDFFATPIAPA